MNPLLTGDVIANFAQIVSSRRDKRVITFGSLALLLGGIVYVLGWGVDNELHRIALNGFLWLWAAIVVAHLLAGVAQRKVISSTITPGVPTA
jgi:hypothetical protein